MHVYKEETAYAKDKHNSGQGLEDKNYTNGGQQMVTYKYM